MVVVQVLLSCIIDGMAEVIRFCGMAGLREPALPMLPSDEIQIHSTFALRKKKRKLKRSRLTLRVRILLYMCPHTSIYLRKVFDDCD